MSEWSVTMTTARRDAVSTDEGRFVRANGIDIHFFEAGTGPDLLLLHGGVVSANPIWNGVPISYASFIDLFAKHFHVVAPDTRGAGRSINAPGSSPSYDHLADDVAALVESLQLDRPAICGFSDGGITATICGIRFPNLVSAIVNDAGFDLFNPNSASFPMMRQILGGSPDATRSNPEAIERMFRSSQHMSAVFDLMVADHDGGQGAGYWKKYLEFAFDRATQSPGYTVEDFGVISAPTLILVGDRDNFCTAEEAVSAYKMLQRGELAILPNVEHIITQTKVETAIEFIRRHLDGDSPSAG
jgi:pimeloyl-ACP methyl ester carboxylesterase